MSKKSRQAKRSSQSTKTLATRLSARSVSGQSTLSITERLLSVFQFSKFQQFFSQRKNIILTLVVIIVLGLLYLLKDVFIVAMVNGQPIYRWTVIQTLEKQGGQQVLDSLVTETLVKQAIKDSDIKIEQEEIDTAIKEIEDRIVAQGMTLDQALVQEGLTKEELIADLTLQRSAEQMVASTVTVTEEEIDTYIGENQEFLPAELTGQELRDTVRQQLYSGKLSETISQWVEGLQAEAQIIYLKNYSNSDPQ